MFGTTRKRAEVIERSIRAEVSSAAVTLAAHAPRNPSTDDLVVSGAPTQAHSLARPTSRTEAAPCAADPTKTIAMEVRADLPGVRESLDCFEVSGTDPTFAATFSRVDMQRISSGDATASMTRRQLRARGAELVARADLVVDRANRLLDDEAQRPRQWASRLVRPGRVSSTAQ